MHIADATESESMAQNSRRIQSQVEPMSKNRIPLLQSWILGPLKYMRLRLEAKLRNDRTKLTGIERIVGHDRLLKRSRSPGEAAAMIYIAQNTGIPVPKVLDTFVVRGQHFIVMEYIRDARSLWEAWSHSSPEELETIAREVTHHIQTMRSLQPPSPQAVCNAAGGPLTDFRLTLSPTGPYDSHADYHRWIGFSHYIDTYGERSADLLDLRHKSWRCVFSHCDFSPRNVLVRDGHVAAIIDWEFSGWYPEYVEYGCMPFACWNAPEWCQRLCRDMDRFDVERRIQMSLLH